MIRPRFNLGSTSKTLNLSLLQFNERSESENLTYYTHFISRFANLYQSLNIFNNFDGCYLI